jgi:hypothetical protein
MIEFLLVLMGFIFGFWFGVMPKEYKSAITRYFSKNKTGEERFEPEKKVEIIKYNHVKPDLGDLYCRYTKNTFSAINICSNCGLTGHEESVKSYEPCPKCGGNVETGYYKNPNDIQNIKYVARWELFNGEWQWLRTLVNLNLSDEELEQEKRKRKFNKIIESGDGDNENKK